jgi:hypothetical protein
MRAIFLRELRRLAPYGAGTLLLAFVFAFVAVMFDDLGLNLHGTLAWARLLGVALLGVATVAPDTSSGAIAFLARMPVARGRVLAAKLGAAAVWALVVAVVPELAFEGRLDEVQIASMLAFAFAAGCLASTMMARTLQAAIVAGILGVTVPLLLAVPADLLLDVRTGKTGVMYPVLAIFGPAFVAIAFLAFVRGDRHRVSMRPALLGLVGLAALELVTFSGVAVAHGFSVSDAPRWLKVQNVPAPESRDGRFVAVTLRGITWCAAEERVALIDREKKTLRLLPTRDVTSPAFSPGGKLLLRNSRGRGGWLVSGDDRDEKLKAAWDDTFEGFGSEIVLWKDERPYFARTRAEKQPDGRMSAPVLEVAAPGEAIVATRPIEPGMRLESALGSKVVLLGGRGLAVLDPWSGEATRAELDEGWRPGECVVAPSGRSALVLASRDSAWSVFALDLDAGARRRIDQVPDFVRGKLLLAAYSPDEKRVAVPGLGMLGILDLERGEWKTTDGGRPTKDLLLRAQDEDPASEASPWRAPVWSRDGRALALGWGPRVDTETGAISGRPSPQGFVAYVTSGLAIRSGEPLVFVDPASGAVLARPFEGR